MVKTILTQKQKSLLKLLSENKDITNNFYLGGGTALAEYYLHHRYSEDLDFFSETEIDPLSIQVILKSISETAGINDIDFQQSFNRNLFFLHFDDEIVKTEFTYYPFPQIENPKVIDNLRIDSLVDIAVNKTFTIYQKPRSRDFIDLYLILRTENLSLGDLKKKARNKFDTHIDPLQMAQQLLEANQLKDYPRMIKEIKSEEWIGFWEKEALALKDKVLK